ncbi:hypothetical protein [Dysgonomonas sp. 25]|uniref:hypothetical protein n=1 Tax=Dysgonomonas sp. 25 TaxID=2302933 RepID=UPI0013D18256|nr:hypothetical protein [Dysgonomonas sp. 25]NDV68012.1 hypothetical protein [Dysgonomonas sp. 25]
MGFFDSLLNAFGGTTSSDVQKNWEENMTLEDIENLERQGCDMTEYRKKYEERIAREKAEREAYLAMLDYAGLDAYKATPRDIDSEFVTKMMTLNKLSEKKRALMVDAPLVYGAVVQAHNELWKSADGGYKAMVVVFALDAQHIYNAEWLNETANRIDEMNERDQVPEDCKRLIKALRDHQSVFGYKLGDTLADGADLWCATFAVDNQALLPDKRLEEGCVVPFLLLEQPRDNRGIELELIPAEFYTK